MIVSFILMVSISIGYILTTDELLLSKVVYFQPLNFFKFFGQVFYASEGVGLILPIRSLFKDW